MIKVKGENKKVLQQRGITLVALVITIILLLILAAISISALTGSGLFDKTKKAQEEHEISAAEEALSTELLSILAEHQGKKDLNNLDGITVAGYNTQVSDIGKIVTMTKNGKEYYFLVDSEYNIQSLNNISGEIGDNDQNSGNGSGSGQVANSKINDFNIKMESMDGLSVKINLDGEITTIDNSSILGYIVLANGKGIKNFDSMPYTVGNLEISTTYTIEVMAIDINGNTKKSNNSISVTTPNFIETILEYPIMTKNGMVNVKYTNPSDETDYYYVLDLTKDCTATDALDKAAYDRDNSTYYDGTSSKSKFYFANDIDIYQVCFKIDSNYSGDLFAPILYNGYVGVPGDGKFIGDGIFHTTWYGKGSNAWQGYFSKISGKVYEMYYDGNIE